MSASTEAVFDMESERDDLDADELTSPPISLPTTPKAEPVRAPIRRTRPANMAGLPSSLSALRPESLPAPTSIRPFLPHESSQTEDRPRSEIVRESLLLADSKARVIEEYHELLDMAQETSDPREAEILKLVAASTPSHRSAWKKDSKAWQVFVSRHEQKIKSAHNAIAEEEEDSTAESNTSRGGYYDESEDDASGLEDDYNLTSNEPIAHSLPIAIAPLSEHKLKFGVPSYQPKTSLSDRPGVLVPPLRKTQSEALKRASYAERDRARSIDPGTLDFTAEEEEKDDPEEEDVVENVEVGGRGRQHALKILEARSEFADILMVASGMWRSLA
ncbi:hypothetical protein EUX98_g2884 [Antrodiella citrinella]|uniref:Uncharacterized protein n=1 Tax=Antrodiella citrinella TaxID=2447956 RepID=A0A4S4MXW0_9APHY|nr:hypothetical protein EUX98_g2884 [Antrodiella citrinella]